MVKYCVALLVMIAFAVPAFAQDYPQLELSFGYGNLSLPNNFEAGLGIGTGGHSGFATHQTFNLASWLGVENYFGYYSLGESSQIGKSELISNVFGGKFSLRRSDRILPYATAGIGGAWLRFPQAGIGTDSTFSTKLGGGVDITINDSLAWKVDVSRMSFHFFDEWNSGLNFSTGIVLRITQ